MTPFVETSVIEHFQIICDDKGDDVISEAFLEHDEAPNTSIAILEGMNLLEAYVEVKNIVERLLLLAIVFAKERLHLAMHLIGRTGFHTTHLIGQTLVVANGKPILSAIRCARLEQLMNLLDHILGKSLLCMIDDEINTAEVVYSFKDIIHVNSVRGDTDGVGFIDITRLVVRQFAALDVVGVIGQVYLYAMINAAL